jgi:hypothetical protein
MKICRPCPPINLRMGHSIQVSGGMGSGKAVDLRLGKMRISMKVE